MSAKKGKEKKSCTHEDLTPCAVFLDDWKEEWWLYQVCENCGKSFLLSGNKVEVV
jgi:hypothetical protein